MKTTLIVSALAATALSKPLLDKKWIVYTTAVDVVTVTATEGGSSGWSWGGWGHGSSSTAAPITTEAPATTAPAWTAPPAAWSTPAPAPAPSPDVTSAAPAAASSSTTNSYAQAILDQHNNHRQNASAPSLTWSDEMASIAAEIAASCTYAHNT
jgi:Cysteine-rich secretory protein family